ncbi:MAG: phage tail tape measure protein [Peptococcaceae bacterium]|nr:phage tail tape measure protein [Peptococcaceae bacterium]
MAVGGVAQLEDSVGVLSTIVNNYAGMNLEASKASDLLFKTVTKGVTTIPELAASMGGVVSSAASVGIAFDDVSAAMATMTSSLGKGSTAVATTKLARLFEELSTTGSQADKEFRSIAGGGFRDFLKSGGSLQEALQMLNKDAKSQNKTINEFFSSVEAGSAALILGSTSANVFSQNLIEMKNSAGATDEAFNTMNTGLKDTFDGLKNKFEWFKVEVGQRLGKAVSGWFDKSQETFNKIESAFDTMFSKVDEGLPLFEAFKIAFKDIIPPDTMAMIDDLGSFLGFIFQKVKDIAGYITGNWPSVKPVVIGIGTAFAAWKIGSVIANVVGLGKELWVVVARLKLTERATWANVAAKAADKVETMAIMALYAGDFARSLWTSVTAIGAQTTAFIVNKAQMGAQAAGMMLLKGVQLVSTGITAELTAAQWALNAAFIASPIGWIVLGIGALIAAGVLLYKNWDTVKAKALDLWAGIQAAFAPIGDFFAGIWSGVQAGFKAFINFIIQGLNFMIRGLNKLSVDIPDWVPLVGGKNLGFSIPEIPMLAAGSKYSPDTFIAGERGPELITGAEGSRVFPSDDTDRIISALESKNRPISVSASPFTPDDRMDEDNVSTEKNININLNGNGSIQGRGLSKDEMLDYLR